MKRLRCELWFRVMCLVMIQMLFLFCTYVFAVDLEEEYRQNNSQTDDSDNLNN